MNGTSRTGAAAAEHTIEHLTHQLTKLGFAKHSAMSPAGMDGPSQRLISDIMIHRGTSVEIGLNSGVVRIPDFAILDTVAVNTALAAMRLFDDYRVARLHHSLKYPQAETLANLEALKGREAERALAAQVEAKLDSHDPRNHKYPDPQFQNLKSCTNMDLLNELESRRWGDDFGRQMLQLVANYLHYRLLTGDFRA